MKKKENQKNSSQSGKTRITIRIDNRTLNWFKEQAAKNSGSYQLMINDFLKQYVLDQENPSEPEIRRIIREELSPYQLPSQPEPSLATDIPPSTILHDLMLYIEFLQFKLTQINDPNQEPIMKQLQQSLKITATEIMKLKTISNSKPHEERLLGLHKGSMCIADDFDAPLPDKFWLGDE